jgi:hypothetical protein
MDQPKSETPTLDIGDTPVPSGSSGSLMEEPDDEAPPAADNEIPSSSDSGLEDEGKSDSDPETQSLSDNSSKTSTVHPPPCAPTATTTYGSILAKSRPKASNSVATNVWHCVHALDSDKPVTIPETEPILTE